MALGTCLTAHDRPANMAPWQFHNWKSRGCRPGFSYRPSACKLFTCFYLKPTLFHGNISTWELGIRTGMWFCFATLMFLKCPSKHSIMFKIRSTRLGNGMVVLVTLLHWCATISSDICPPHYPHQALLHFFLQKHLSDPINLPTVQTTLLLYRKHSYRNPANCIPCTVGGYTSVLYCGIWSPSYCDVTNDIGIVAPLQLVAITINTNILAIRARWISKLLEIKTGHLHSYVKLNFKTSLFSCIFWFEAIFLGKSALLVFGLFTL